MAYELHPTGTYKVQITECVQGMTKQKYKNGKPKPTYPMLTVDFTSESGTFRDWIILQWDWDVVAERRENFRQALGLKADEEFTASDLVGKTLFAELAHVQGTGAYADRMKVDASYLAIDPNEIPF